MSKWAAFWPGNIADGIANVTSSASFLIFLIFISMILPKVIVSVFILVRNTSIVLLWTSIPFSIRWDYITLYKSPHFHLRESHPPHILRPYSCWLMLVLRIVVEHYTTIIIVSLMRIVQSLILLPYLSNYFSHILYHYNSLVIRALRSFPTIS